MTADQGPTSFESSPATQAPMQTLRAWAEIDLAAIHGNVLRLREAAGPAEVMAVVKADAYGHGLLPSAAAARSAGATWLGVALLEEALALRDAGDEGRLLAWLPTPGDRFADCVRADIDLNAAAPWMLAEIAAGALSVGRTARVHLKIDTGLGRGGASESGWPELVRLALARQRSGEIEIVGIWSHLAHADNPNHPMIARQLAAFDDAIEYARGQGVRPQVCHISNSAATLTLPRARYDLVRPGISVYGISPGPEVGTSKALGLRPAMSFAARLVQVKRLPAGHGVSYAHQYVTKRETTVGLVPVGYADGIQRSASNAGPVLAAGRQRRIAGRVCMDQFVLDLGDDLAVEGDQVLLFGPGDRGEPTAEDWAAVCQTIAYEIVTCVGPRIERIFIGGQ